MPSKKKKTPDAVVVIEEHLDTPAAVAPPADPVEQFTDLPPLPESGWQWPESTENRECIVPHTEHDRSNLALRCADAQKRYEALEQEKKEETKRLSDNVKAAQAAVANLCDLIKAGGEKREVPCQWFFEVQGYDRVNGWLKHPEWKTLVRLDTHEVIEVKRISDEDRQGSLALTAAEDPEAMGRELAARGWALNERDAPGDGQSVFYIIQPGEPGAERDIQADNLTDAYKAALAMTAPALAVVSPGANEEGTLARRDGISRDDCPYEESSTQRVAWLSGWDDQDAIQETEDELPAAA